MEVLMDILPMDLHLQKVALETMTRLIWSEQWLDWRGFGHTKRKTHVDMCFSLRTQIPELEFPCDHKMEVLPEGRKFHTVIKSREEWKEMSSEFVTSEGVTCFTDGSRVLGATGAAFLTILDGEIKNMSTPLGVYATVPQSEVLAVLEAAKNLDERNLKKNVKIFVDCMSVLTALTSAEPVSGLVRECFDNLNGLATSAEVELHWIPAHSGYSGNEEVDVLAKEATEVRFLGPEPVIPVSKQFIKTVVSDWFRKLHCDRWSKRLDCRQSKMVLKVPLKSIGNYARGLSRISLRNLTQIITGHNHLQKHLQVMGVVDSSVCRNCGRDEETSYHFICRCDKFSLLRNEIFGSFQMDPEDMSEYPLSELLDFINKSGRFKLDHQGILSPAH